MESSLEKLFIKAIDKKSGSELLQKFEEFICRDGTASQHISGVHKAFMFEIPFEFRGKTVKALKAYFEDKKFVENKKCTSSYNMPHCNFAFTRKNHVCQWETETIICKPEFSTEVVICF